METHQVQTSKRGVSFVFKCKTKSLPKVARTKVLQRNIFEDRNMKMGVHARRPSILFKELMVPI
jgi:hypothetical protein